uniref:Uncharacterized protein n=1 Tax=Rhizophora mucronata TaxID=61149 RepID=A0A2P2N6D0_RHIMU
MNFRYTPSNTHAPKIYFSKAYTKLTMDQVSCNLKETSGNCDLPNYSILSQAAYHATKGNSCRTL